MTSRRQTQFSTPLRVDLPGLNYQEQYNACSNQLSQGLAENKLIYQEAQRLVEKLNQCQSQTQDTQQLLQELNDTRDQLREAKGQIVGCAIELGQYTERKKEMDEIQARYAAEEKKAWQHEISKRDQEISYLRTQLNLVLERYRRCERFFNAKNNSAYQGLILDEESKGRGTVKKY